MFLVVAKNKYKKQRSRCLFNTKIEAEQFVYDNGFDRGTGEYSIKNLEVID